MSQRREAYTRKKIDLGPTIEQPDDEAYDEMGEEWKGRELEDKDIAKPSEKKFPDPIIRLEDDEEKNKKCLDQCKTWLRARISEIEAEHREKLDVFERWEALYRALPEKTKQTIPFLGACDDIIPVIAMAVDPVQARLDVGIMKQEPVFTVDPLRKSWLKYKPALEDWIDFNQKHRWHLRNVVAPRFMELAKLGTMVLKTIYDREEAPVRTYKFNKDTGHYATVTKKQLKFTGARVVGVPRRKIMWPAGYASIHKCPIVVERLKLTLGELRVAEASGKMTNVNAVMNYGVAQPSTDDQLSEDLNQQHAQLNVNSYDVDEVWFDYDIDKDGYDEHLVAHWHGPSSTFLSLRFNFYFHQRKPYTVIPYSVVDGSLDGLGLCEMLEQFQIAMTRWHRMASDNAYLANTRVYIARKDSGIEQVPRLYAGRVFYVNDPSKDLKPFQAGDIYPSTMAERQNLFGMAEKRTGVSDYLTGRESPVLGSRATATSTVALIQEGTKRVEETLENVRQGMAEVIENAFYIWIQFGTEDVEDLVFGKEDTAAMIRDFFTTMTEQNVSGGLSISLSATNAGENKQSRQQMQLAIINLMMGYFEKLLNGGATALQAQQTMPAFTQMVSDTFTASRKLFIDLLRDYDIKNPEQYIPDLTQYLNGQGPTPTPSGPDGGLGGPAQPPGVAAGQQGPGGPSGGGFAPAGGGDGLPFLASLAGQGAGA